MRRFLLVLLLLIMPLQGVWASAADDCLQSSIQPDRAIPVLSVDADDSAACTAHCAACHAGCGAALMPSTVDALTARAGQFPAGLDAPFESHIPIGPERPDRSDLPLAA